jgi:hypothetical protein
MLKCSLSCLLFQILHTTFIWHHYTVQVKTIILFTVKHIIPFNPRIQHVLIHSISFWLNFNVTSSKDTSLKVPYHEIVCQLRRLVYSLGPNNMPRISFKLGKSHIKNIRGFKRGPLYVKWRVLDFTDLLNSTLQSRGLPQ